MTAGRNEQWTVLSLSLFLSLSLSLSLLVSSRRIFAAHKVDQYVTVGSGGGGYDRHQCRGIISISRATLSRRPTIAPLGTFVLFTVLVCQTATTIDQNR